MKESWFWKRELKLAIGEMNVWLEDFDTALNDLESLELKIDEPAFRLEKALFFSAFIVRKLLENHKVSQSLSEMPVACRLVKAKPHDESLVLGVDAVRDFCHRTAKAENVPLLRVCHEIVHSKILDWEVTENNSLLGFYVASDWNSEKRLLAVAFDEWLSKVEIVSENFPSSFRKTTDMQTGKITVQVE